MSLTEVEVPARPKPKRKKFHRSRKYSGEPTVAVPPDDELGPAMLKLNTRQRAFVMELSTGPSGYGSEARAARAAGYVSANNGALQSIATRIIHNGKVQEALREVGVKQIRAAAFAAIRQTEKIANDLSNPNCLKACLALMDRGGFAVETHHTVTVEHKSLDDQALEALRTLRTLKASREQMEEMFGRAGLLRYENILAEKATPVPMIEEKTE